MALAVKRIEEKDRIRGLIGYSGSYTFHPFKLDLKRAILERMSASWPEFESYHCNFIEDSTKYEYITSLLDNIIRIRNDDDIKALRMKLAELARLKQSEHVLERLERLEEEFTELVESTWNYVFKEDAEEIQGISTEMLEDARAMRESFKRLQDNYTKDDQR